MPQEQQGRQVLQFHNSWTSHSFEGLVGFFEGNLNGNSADKGAVFVVEGDGLPANFRNAIMGHIGDCCQCVRMLLMANLTSFQCRGQLSAMVPHRKVSPCGREQHPAAVSA